VSTHGATVLISSHLVHEQERVCDWIGVMDGGRLVTEMPMHAFRSGIKRLRIADAPTHTIAAPFGVLARRVGPGREEEWVVRDWRQDMTSWFSTGDAALREVIDLDLEESFVETLRAARDAGGRAA
jgi:ABC-2 type transport system ATP-binding protein